jgi:hypothetical protein
MGTVDDDTDGYDFTELTARWEDARTAADGIAPTDAEHPFTTLGLFLGSLIEDLREAIEELPLDLPVPAPRIVEEDDRPVVVGPIVLKGRHPVSLLNELCQSRGWPQPFFNITQSGESHTPNFSGVCVIDTGDDVYDSEVSAARSKAELKKELARQMLIEEFGAQEDY